MVNKNFFRYSLKLFVILLVALTCVMTTFSIYILIQNNKLEEQNLKAAKQLEGANSKIDELVNQNEQLKGDLQKAQEDLSQAQSQLEQARKEIEILTPKKVVYLTFDDGPSPMTPHILSVLEKYKIKATFFVIYNSHSDYIKQIAQQGHTIGLHSFSHDYKLIYSSEQAYFDDLNKISNLVKDLTGIESKIIRFPGGSSNSSSSFNKGIMTRLISQVAQKGYIYHDWNVDCGDGKSAKYTPQQILNNTINGSVKNGKDIPVINLLLHDSLAKKSTAEALEAIIEYYISKGYSFLPITERTQPIQHPVNN